MASSTGMRGRFCRAARVRNGFSLVELLVVIGIIALLIGILLPVLSKARESSRRTVCMSNLRTLGQAMFVYAHFSRDSLPNGNPPLDWSSYDGANAIMVHFAKTYVKSPEVFRCPSESDPVPTDIVTADHTLPNSARMSYDFYFLYWAPEKGPILTKMKGKAPLAWDVDGGEIKSPLKNHKGGGNVLVADGHVEWQDMKLWESGNWPSLAGKYYAP
jgi:prepilin-type N-terminal cleavage/methylation domain-containing protein/prepilin-type processing-associated H-X9-DG protein